MKMKFLLITFLSAALLAFPKPGLGQILSLGVLENFTFYTGDGAVTNSGTSAFTGDVGSNLGIISGFELPTTMTGIIRNADSVTAQARIDLLNIYIHLNDLAITNTHAPAFGGNETITQGVYAIPGAGSIGGTITLDGEGNPNATFIIKFEGAMTVGAGSTVILTNGTLACNVFWIAEGAIAMGATVTMKGTLIAHPGAISMGTGGDLEGRMISMAGAITFGPGLAGKPACHNAVSISCINSCVNNILGASAGFALFTASGAVANTGISGVIGNIGSNAGAVSGWESSVVVGNIYTTDATTAQAKTDLQAAYAQLYNSAATNTSHTPAFGSGETLNGGVYAIAAAGSLAGNITLNGQGNTNAVFIFKFGAAFSIGARSKIILINGARRCNIFWIAEGAISIAAFSIMKGNFIANNGAVNMGANGFLEGRLLSTNGAIGFNTGTGYIAYKPCSTVILAVELTAFSASCEKQHTKIKWSTATERNNYYFTIERSIDGINWELAGTVTGAGNSMVRRNYIFTDMLPTSTLNYYYRLKQSDTFDNFKYSQTVFVKSCESNASADVSVFPNPSTGVFNLLLSGDQSKPSSTEILDVQGVVVYHSNIFQSKIDMTGKPAGLYIIRVIVNSKIITGRIIIVK